MASWTLWATSLLLYGAATVSSAAPNTLLSGARENAKESSSLPRSIEGGLFRKAKKDMPGLLCPGADIHHEQIGTIPLRDDVFWVPHSRIVQDGTRCGTGPYGFNSEYMLVVRGEDVASEKVAQGKGLGSVYALLQKNKLGTMALRVLSSKSKVFVGIEAASDRRCGGKTVFPRGSVFLFLSPTEDVNLSFAMFSKHSLGMLSVLQTPQKLCAFTNDPSSGHLAGSSAVYNGTISKKQVNIKPPSVDTPTALAESNGGVEKPAAQPAPPRKEVTPVDLQGLVLKKNVNMLDGIQCPSTSIIHESIGPSPQRSDVFFVPHSSIMHDGVRCGSGRPAEFMLLVNSGTQSGLQSALNLLKNNKKAEEAFQKLSPLGDVFVGFESSSDRYCGGKIAFPKGSVMLFLRPRAQVTLSFSTLPMSKVNMLSVFGDQKLCSYVDEKLEKPLTKESVPTIPKPSNPATVPSLVAQSGATKPGPVVIENTSSPPAVAPSSSTSLGFKPSSLVMKELKKVGAPGDGTQCPSASIRHLEIEPLSPNSPLSDAFKVEHKSISHDNAQCGTGKGGEIMIVVRGSILLDEKSAAAKEMKLLYDMLSRNPQNMAFMRAMNTVSPVYIGVELMSDRVCGGKVVFPRYTTLIFIHPTNSSLNTGSGRIMKNAIGMVATRGSQKFCVYGSDAAESKLADSSAATLPATPPSPATQNTTTKTAESSKSVLTSPSPAFQPPSLSGLLMKKVTADMAGSQCPSADILHSKVSVDKQLKKQFKVLHSDIMQDRQVCGTGSSSEYMTIALAKNVLDEQVATSNGLQFVWELLNKDSRKMNALRSLHTVEPVFVGIEATSDRRCGGQVVFPRGSIFIFIGPTHIRFNNLPKYSVGMLALFESKGYCAYANADVGTQPKVVSRAVSRSSFRLEQVSKIRLGKTFEKNGNGIDCPSTFIVHDNMTVSPTRDDVFWVPHSSISHDSVRCGGGRSSGRMIAVRGEDITSEKIAAKRNLAAFWYELKKNDRALKIFQALVTTSSSIFVGLEKVTDRQCGSKIVFPRKSVLLFVRASTDFNLGFTRIKKDDVGMISVMENGGVCVYKK